MTASQAESKYGTGRFIVIEGADGSGKTTQARILAERLGARLTHEPGDTAIGAVLRGLLLDPDLPMVPETEAMLMAADRAQHVAEVIRPALLLGTDVVCDRYIGSTLAYQGHGRGLDLAGLAAVSKFASNDLRPDLVLYLQIDSRNRHGRFDGTDRFEKDRDFAERVADGYEHVAAREGWYYIDASGTVDEVTVRINDAVEMWFTNPISEWPNEQEMAEPCGCGHMLGQHVYGDEAAPCEHCGCSGFHDPSSCQYRPPHPGGRGCPFDLGEPHTNPARPVPVPEGWPTRLGPKILD